MFKNDQQLKELFLDNLGKYSDGEFPASVSCLTLTAIGRKSTEFERFYGIPASVSYLTLTAIGRKSTEFERFYGIPEDFMWFWNRWFEMNVSHRPVANTNYMMILMHRFFKQIPLSDKLTDLTFSVRMANIWVTALSNALPIDDFKILNGALFKPFAEYYVACLSGSYISSKEKGEIARKLQQKGLKTASYNAEEDGPMTLTRGAMVFSYVMEAQISPWHWVSAFDHVLAACGNDTDTVGKFLDDLSKGMVSDSFWS